MRLRRRPREASSPRAWQARIDRFCQSFGAKHNGLYVWSIEESHILCFLPRKLTEPGQPAVPEQEPQRPAVPIRKSVTAEYIVCLEDGKKLKMLKRHLHSTYGMISDEYRAKWGLPRHYPMVAPAYAEKRSAFAKSIGLGRSRFEPEDLRQLWLNAPAAGRQRNHRRKQTGVGAGTLPPASAGQGSRPASLAGAMEFFKLVY